MLKTVNRRKAQLILDWCISKFGMSKFYDDYPRIRVYKSKGTSYRNKNVTNIMGTQFDGLISIYFGNIKSYKELCNTIIHEYKHYLLSDAEYIRIDKLMSLKYKNDSYNLYYNHPHEIKARKAEKKWGGVCYESLKKELHKRK